MKRTLAAIVANFCSLNSLGAQSLLEELRETTSAALAAKKSAEQQRAAAREREAHPVLSIRARETAELHWKISDRPLSPPLDMAKALS
jgi:hypothetical protein